MFMRAHFLAIATTLCPAALAQEADVMFDWSQGDMTSALADLGAVPTAEGGPGEYPYLAVSRFEFPFEVRSAVCKSAASEIRCRGAEFSTVIELGDRTAATRAALNFFVSPVTLSVTDEGALLISRYVIFDSGITRGNLKSNAELFMSATRSIYRALKANGYLG
jgi:hypothetical protein